MSIRCGIAFLSADEFRAAFVARGEVCFVPYPDEVEAGSVLEVDVTVNDARLEVRGEVVGADFDEAGNVGLSVKLDAPSLKVVADLDAELREGRSAPQLFATTRMQMTPVPLPVQATPQPVPTPGDERPEIIAPGTVVDGRFRIEAHLATGGMGEVYKAEHVHLKRPVALKMLRRALSHDTEMWGRFEREAQLVSQLENPHIVRVFDFGRTAEGQLFLAMEFVEGETLDKRLARGPLPPAEAVEIIAQVLDGLTEAHGLGVVHRDLKPPNIMLGHRRDGGERAKILDFGIARLSDGLANSNAVKLTQLGVVVGTPAYLAPEQALADELDHRTDIYAMGCVAYELLTGQPPFTGSDLRKVISQHLTSAPVDPVKLRPELAALPGLGAAVLKALAKEKEHRFQNVTEFGEALRAALRPGQTPVPRAALVPEPSAPWPPPAPEWQPPPVPAGAPAVSDAPVVVAAADDFFASVGASPLLAVKGDAPAGPLSGPFRGVVADELLARLLAEPPDAPGEGVFVRLEVLGPPPKSPPALACLGRVLEAVAASDGLLAGHDDEGVTFAFIGRGGSPAGRATRAMLAAREAVALESARLKVAATLRGLMGAGALPLSAQLTDQARQQLARARANTLWLEQRLAAPAARLCELTHTDAKGVVGAGALKRRTRVAGELVGRRAMVDGLERRLTSLQQGVAAPLVVTGPSGSGHTSLSNLLVSVAKKRGVLALSTSGLAEPWGALIELLCVALNVDPAERMTRLKPALEPLPLVDSARQAALCLAGVAPLPIALSPGQAAHALRVVLRGVAVDRPVVLSFDGLHAMDAQSVEAFVAMASRPASRELIVGFTAPSGFDARLTGLQTAALTPLSQAELQRLASVALGSVAGPQLTQYLLTESDGVPGLALELVSWLDDGGLLVDIPGAVELAEPGVGAPRGGAARAGFEVLPVDARQTLHAAALLGERFDWAILREVFPGASVAVVNALMSSGWLVAEGAKRGRFRSAALRAQVPPLGRPESQGAHLRCASALIALGKTSPASVDTLQLAEHLNAAGEGLRAAPLWKHALEQAMARRDARAAGRAWEGVAAAMALVPASEQTQRGRVDALARAAAQALVGEDPAKARAALTVAAPLAAQLAQPSPEFLLLEARVLRLEGRRVKAAEVLASAEQAAAGSAVLALVLAERGESREVEGDLDGSAEAFEAARRLAGEVGELARWHGEVDLPARLEARLATICFARRDVGKARALLEASLAKWRLTGWTFAEARVLSTLGTVLAYQQRFQEAAQAYEAAALAGSRCGDLQFQARALLQQAKAIRKLQGESAAMRQVALEARKLCVVLGWEQGRLDASAMLGQS